MCFKSVTLWKSILPGCVCPRTSLLGDLALTVPPRPTRCCLRPDPSVWEQIPASSNTWSLCPGC